MCFAPMRTLRQITHFRLGDPVRQGHITQMRMPPEKIMTMMTVLP